MVRPGLPILDQKLQGKVQRGGIRDRIGGGFHTDSWRNFGIFVRIVDPALSDLVEDRTQSGAVLDLRFSIFDRPARFIRNFRPIDP